MTVVELAERLKAFDIRAEAVAVIQRTSDEYMDRNKKQLKQGERKDGSLIGEYQSAAYAEKKLRKNPLAEGSIDLIDTEDYIDSWRFQLTGDDIIIDPSDCKTGDLEQRFWKGNGYYGLNDKNQEEYNTTVFLPEFLAVIEQKTGLTAG